MKKFLLLFMLACLFPVMTFAGNDNVMITRDGSMLRVKIIRISPSEIVFQDLDHRRKGELKAPTDYIFMIMKEKGSTICFDEEGNQTTQPARELEKKVTYLFMNDGRYFPIYNVSVKKEEITYQLKDKKKAPYNNTSKNEVFMLRNEDGTTTLFNNNYIKNHSKKTTVTKPAIPSSPVPSTPSASTSSNSSSNLLATRTQLPKQFFPAQGLSDEAIESKVNGIMPYTLFRKGSMAEYIIFTNGKQERFYGLPTYLQQVVMDEKIENGLLVSYVQQYMLNKKHEPSKGISAKFKSIYYPTEIDTAGNFHLTHDIKRDFMILSKRQGYAMIIPGNVKTGDRLNCSTIADKAKNIFGGDLDVKAAYSDFVVEGEEQLTTPAGTFDCIKLTGKMTETNNGSKSYNCSWWLARGIGFVKYEYTTVGDKNNDLITILLNKVDIK